MEQIIVIIGFFLIYYNVSGLATTNILRLTSGNTAPVLASKCFCGSCGAAISPFYQLPIISYVLCGGRCSSCNCKIPLDALYLEITLLIGMFLFSAVTAFSFLGVTLSYVFYEAVRTAVILRHGRRQSGFARQYVIAVLAMLPYWLLTMFVALIYKAVGI